MIILGLETSCDETAAAVVESKKGHLSVLSNIISSQAKLHSRWGGVVPNLAAREHLKNMRPIVQKVFKKARIQPEDIDLIAVTQQLLVTGEINAEKFACEVQKVADQHK